MTGKKSKRKRIILFAAAAIVIVAAVVLLFGGDTVDSYAEKYEGHDLGNDIAGLGGSGVTYAKYLQTYADAAQPKIEIPIAVAAYTDGVNLEVHKSFAGANDVLQSDEGGYAEWTVTVPEAGLYSIYMEYYPIENRGIDIERYLYINGELPFTGADALTFERVWGDKGEAQMDNQGNEIRPSQVELPKWEGSYFMDYMGYYTEPYLFYFEQGENTIRLEAVNEPLVIRSLKLTNLNEVEDYAAYIAGTDDSTFARSTSYQTFSSKIQGEDALYRSSPSLYALFDRSSSNTEPYSAAKIRLNMIGGESWRVAGQWIEWEIEVPEDGYYEISLKARQNYERGFVSSRTLYIDGVIPFAEVSEIAFSYSNGWEMMTLSAADGTPYQFALTAGKHTLRLEVTLGDLGGLLTQMEDSILQMNEMYRKVLILTGTEPDLYRDYQIDSVYPEVVEAMKLESMRLYKLVDDVVAFTGENTSTTAVALTLAAQLEEMGERPDKIPKMLKNFKENISSLGTTILTMSESRLDLDYIFISATGVEKPDVSENFFQKAAHEVRSFFASFFEDYNALGNVYDEKEAIEVWMLAGRDQSTVLKTMIDDTFTPESDIAVNVRLVAADTLLPAVVAGTGPHVALSVAQGQPVNFALRNAAVDLSQFPGFDEVISEYKESAYETYKYNGGVYAIPETQIYNVMFYRTDLLAELGVEPPETWQELISILPTIQGNNLNVGAPSVERKFGTTAAPDLSGVFSLLYQNGGSLYNANGARTLIDSEAGVSGFELYTMLFTHYKLPTVYDAVNRFRSGEMPIILADYNTFNTLVVFAPEIRGLWDFTLVPGTVMADGTIDHSVSSWGVCSMILGNIDNQDLAWEFMRWWASSDTQVRYGRELEAVMGSSARYATANVDAFQQLSWSKKQSDLLNEQWDWVVGIPEVPGGYYTNWHVTNAVRKVINDKDDPRETLLDYARTINEELDKKRIEFGIE